MTTRSAPRRITDLELIGVTGEQIHVPDPEHVVHLQFCRFAGCPICILHLQYPARGHCWTPGPGAPSCAAAH